MRVLIILVLFIPSILLGGDEHKFKGDYKTNEIRSLWMTCHQSMTRHTQDPASSWLLCDCFLDSLRGEVKYSDFKKMDESKRYEITFRLTTNCWEYVKENRLT